MVTEFNNLYNQLNEFQNIEFIRDCDSPNEKSSLAVSDKL